MVHGQNCARFTPNSSQEPFKPMVVWLPEIAGDI